MRMQIEFPCAVARNFAKAMLTCCLILATAIVNGAAEERESSSKVLDQSLGLRRVIEPANASAETLPTQLAQIGASASGAIKFWHVNDVGFVYTDGSKAYFEILDGRTKFLWDPTDQIYADATDVLGKLQLSKMHIGFPPGGQPLMLDGHTEIVVRQEPIETNFNDHFEIVSSGQTVGDFYLITRGGDITTDRFCCDNRTTPIESLRQSYGTAINLGGVKLHSGLILLSVAAIDPKSPLHASIYFIGLRDLPARPVRFGRNVFLIPYSSLAPALKRAGVSLHARYGAVLRVMTEAKQVKQSLLGQLVKADQFASVQSRGRP